MFDIIIVDTGGYSFGEAERYAVYLSAYRRGKLGRKKSDVDKLLSLTAGLLTGLELSRRTGIPQNKLSYRHGSFGKPYLIGAELQFSVSHTSGAVCAAFSDGGEIGVDIERKDRRVSQRLFDRVLSDSEKPLAKSGEDFVRLWVQKEAFLKRLGTGIAGSMQGADTTLLRDTAVFECGEYLVGASGKDVGSAEIRRITLKELLAEYDGLTLTV